MMCRHNSEKGVQEDGSVRDGIEMIERYKVLREIGRGGSSRVYLAEDVRLGKRWAVKGIARDGTGHTEAAAARAWQEARFLGELDHPAFPRVVEMMRGDDEVRIVMDYIEGETLEAILAREGALRPERAAAIARELCGMLAYLHSRKPPVIYRDLKPANLICTADGHWKIIDFGIAMRRAMRGAG